MWRRSYHLSETRGLLHRHHVFIELWEHQGKETNLLEYRETGTVPTGESCVTEYGTGYDDFQRFVLPIIRKVPSQRLADLVNACGVGVSRQQVSKIVNGVHVPHSSLETALINVAVGLAVAGFGDSIPEQQWRHQTFAESRWREIVAAYSQTRLAHAVSLEDSEEFEL